MKQKQRKYVTGILVLLLFTVAGMWYAFRGDGFLTGKSNREEFSGVLASGETTSDIQQQEVEINNNNAAEEKNEVVVYICGAVMSPGVYIMPIESRLYEVIEAAGGFTEAADAAYHNLARHITDGERIYILTVAETQVLTVTQQVEGEDGSRNSDGDTKGQVNLNTATVEQLMELPGVGEAKAISILEYREKIGTFADVTELMNVSGIGESMFEKIKDKVVIE